MKLLRVDLKVCEGCGALWLRAMGHGVYCKRCAELLADFPAPRGRSRRGRRPRILQPGVVPMPAAGGVR